MRRLLLVLLLCLALPVMAKKKLVEGDVPPDNLGAVDGGEAVSLAQLRGSVVVATFWASWCSPCLQELPVLENLQRTVPKEALRVVAINIDEDVGDYRKIMKHLADATITITRDRRGRSRESYGVSAIPHMFMIDHEGRIAHMHRGYGPDMLEEFVGEINALLDARQSALAAQAAVPTTDEG